MRIKYGFLITLLILVSAGALHAAPKWTNGNAKVASIMWRPDLKGFYVQAGTMDNPDGCPTGTFYELSSSVSSDSDRNRLVSILLSAKADGSKMHVWVDGCGSYGPLFTGLEID